jgi:hypothetical protein
VPAARPLVRIALDAWQHDRVVSDLPDEVVA